MKEKRLGPAAAPGLEESLVPGPRSDLSEKTSFSVEEAIRRFKAEIIAPDWRLTAKRIAALEAALAVFTGEFSGRPDALALLIMARNVLGYMRRRQKFDSYECVSFFKETMAQSLNLYESDRYEADYDARLFSSAYRRFQALKKKLQIPVADMGSAGMVESVEKFVRLEEKAAEDMAAGLQYEEADNLLVRKVAALSRDMEVLIRRLDQQDMMLAQLLEMMKRLESGKGYLPEHDAGMVNN